MNETKSPLSFFSSAFAKCDTHQVNLLNLVKGVNGLLPAQLLGRVGDFMCESVLLGRVFFSCDLILDRQVDGLAHF